MRFCLYFFLFFFLSLPPFSFSFSIYLSFTHVSHTPRVGAEITKAPRRCLRINETRSFVVRLSRVIDNYSSRRVASRNVYQRFSVA